MNLNYIVILPCEMQNFTGGRRVTMITESIKTVQQHCLV